MRVCQFRHFGTVSEARVHRCSLISVAKARALCQTLGPLQAKQLRSKRVLAHNAQNCVEVASNTTNAQGIPTSTHYKESLVMEKATSSTSASAPEAVIPEDLALEIRKLAHDLSNALEIVVQTGYLLSTADLKRPASDWLRMLDTGTQKALEINMNLRNFIKLHTSR